MKANPGQLFILILAFEAILSIGNLSHYSSTLFLAESVRSVFPVVGNFLSNPTSNPDVAPYIALTLLLMPLKIYAAYFIIMRFSKSDKTHIAYFPLSNASIARKIISSIFVLLITLGLIGFVLFYGDDFYTSSEATRRIRANYRVVSEGGIGMWIGWSVVRLIVLASVMGLLFVFIAEWFSFCRQKLLSRHSPRGH